jgi:hypothetical protein
MTSLITVLALFAFGLTWLSYIAVNRVAVGAVRFLIVNVIRKPAPHQPSALPFGTRSA